MRKTILLTTLVAAGLIAADAAVQAQSYGTAAGQGMGETGPEYGRRDEMFGGNAFNPGPATGPNSAKSKAAGHRRDIRAHRKGVPKRDGE